MSSGRDHDRSIDGVWVHAGLVVVVHGNKCPVGDNSSDAKSSVGVLAGDEVLNGGGIKELDVGERKNLGQKGGSEKSLWRLARGSNTMLEVRHTACFTTTKSPSSSKGTPRSVRKASAGLRMTMALKSWPPSHAPPPGETEASMMAILRSGRALPSMYAVLRPQDPAPTMTMSDSA